MLIDWFTVAAQAINFLILIWLLKRFLYRPVLDAIESREKLIASELADAETKRAEAHKERDEFQQKNEEFDRKRTELMSQATANANAERLRLLEEARKAADALRVKRHDALIQEQQNLYDEIKRRTSQEVFAIARKTLQDLAETRLEERISKLFTDRLRAIDGEEKKEFGIALKGLTAPVLVRSAFELPSQQRDAIQAAINETFSADFPVRYETAPEIIGGIELTANGRKVAWSIADYLVSLETSIGELLKDPSQTSAPAKPESKLQTQAPFESKASGIVEVK